MRVAFIGLGIMGSRQAANLVKAGHELHVFNRTRETAESWAQEHGATVAGSPREAADGAGAVITMVVDGAQVGDLLLGDDGAAHGAPQKTLLIDRPPPRPPENRLFIACTTPAPEDARRIGGTLTEQGHGFVDAPVTGSAPKAEDGTPPIKGRGQDRGHARPRPRPAP